MGTHVCVGGPATLHVRSFVLGSSCGAEVDTGAEQSGDDEDSPGPILQVGGLAVSPCPMPHCHPWRGGGTVNRGGTCPAETGGPWSAGASSGS